MHRLPVVVSIISALTLSGCGGGDGKEVTATNVKVGTALVAPDPAGDVTIVRKRPVVEDPIDIRSVTSTRTVDGNLEVVIAGENIQGEARRTGEEGYAVDVYMGLDKYYAITAGRRGQVNVVDFATKKISRPGGGSVVVEPEAGTVTMVVPLAAIGDLPSMSILGSASIFTEGNGDEITSDEAEFPLDRGI